MFRGQTGLRFVPPGRAVCALLFLGLAPAFASPAEAAPPEKAPEKKAAGTVASAGDASSDPRPAALGSSSPRAEPRNKGPANVSGTALRACSTDPMTGWFRDGHCRTDARDRGIHVVCAQVTEAFLQYSKAQGNDLITPSPEHRFPGLKPGDRWCLCAARYREAVEAGVGPPVVLEATHPKALKYLPKEVLEEKAVTPKDAP